MFLPEQASVFTLPEIERTLANHRAQEVTPKASTRQAAVAIIMRNLTSNPGEEEILFIKRAEKEGDPWSGHMAFPGGHLDDTDAHLRGAAERETMEEIALDLSAGRYLGAIDHQHAQPRGRVLDMLIAPHVFEIEGDPLFNPNYEVDEVVWAPMQPLIDNQIHDTETMPMAGTPTIFNGYRLAQGHFVWGLTYRILKTFFSTVNPTWQPPNEL